MPYAHVPHFPISNTHTLTRALDANATHPHALVFNDDDDTPPRIPTPLFSATTHPHTSPHPCSRRRRTPTHPHTLVFDDDDDDTPARISTPSLSTTTTPTHPHAPAFDATPHISHPHTSPLSPGYPWSLVINPYPWYPLGPHPQGFHQAQVHQSVVVQQQ
ncbi:hypothetical protein BDN71DRAFT_1506706 [Pleurotus eryngii]|uniref:Uncharacterized protein n=1 Tax=Pleurotus eryngii TaxID=5323 RepID=A0A9P6A137_PLEER|nr:hypothetical protein BDN71DRAFT_1506706 [Pleurotus eryngii]